mmetsp:Transcript_21266/g.39543  ORF Transcript_21266/g.39543 Transcript_21266/m.39543 type:complete len:359 (-) Transcript_21266:1490-2566(-)
MFPHAAAAAAAAATFPKQILKKNTSQKVNIPATLAEVSASNSIDTQALGNSTPGDAKLDQGELTTGTPSTETATEGASILPKEDVPQDIHGEEVSPKTSSSRKHHHHHHHHHHHGQKSKRRSKSSRVRLVELPDYLAMVAREHQRQLLEKQRRDLLVAAEAANAREAKAQALNAGPRSQNVIRRGYLDRLGIAGSAPAKPPSSTTNSRLDMGLNARRAAIASARTRRRPPSMRVKLREPRKSSKSSSFLKTLKSWMSSENSEMASSAPGELARVKVNHNNAENRKVDFNGTVDVFFIPARSDYPAKVKHAIWHTRSEFVEMVMGNMDQVELEMQQEDEARRRLQDLKANPPPTPRIKQ